MDLHITRSIIRMGLKYLVQTCTFYSLTEKFIQTMPVHAYPTHIDEKIQNTSLKGRYLLSFERRLLLRHKVENLFYSLVRKKTYP